MIIDLYYSTVGLMLDIMILTLPILVHFKCDYKTRIKVYSFIYAVLFIVLGFLNHNVIINYLIMFGIISVSMYFIIKVDYRKFFLYVLYFVFIFTLDVLGVKLLNPIYLLVYSMVYKLSLIYIFKNFYITLDMQLKEKILSGASVSVIILLAIIIGGVIYV